MVADFLHDVTKQNSGRPSVRLLRETFDAKALKIFDTDFNDLKEEFQEIEIEHLCTIWSAMTTKDKKQQKIMDLTIEAIKREDSLT